MTKYTFTMTDNVDGEYPEEPSRELTVSIDNIDSWPDILPHFMLFLRGCGFIFDKYDELEVSKNPSNMV